MNFVQVQPANFSYVFQWKPHPARVCSRFSAQFPFFQFRQHFFQMRQKIIFQKNFPQSKKKTDLLFKGVQIECKRHCRTALLAGFTEKRMLKFN
jgi:hypothetical protein